MNLHPTDFKLFEMEDKKAVKLNIQALRVASMVIPKMIKESKDEN